jgi:hypothetical protein
VKARSSKDSEIVAEGDMLDAVKKLLG